MKKIEEQKVKNNNTVNKQMKNDTTQKYNVLDLFCGCGGTTKGFGAQYLDFDKPSYTISARYWKDGYDALVKYSETEIRRLTITELKRIQTFPDDYEICGNNKEIIMQIGNAVACKFAKYLGKHLIKTLQQTNNDF